MDVTSSTDVCNLALDLLSAGTVSDVENPTTATEEFLSRWYNLTRKRLLREHPWNFATKRASLSASATPPPFGFTAQYPVPNDFVRLLYVVQNTTQDSELPANPDYYKLEGGNIQTSSQVTDDGVLRIKYIYDIKSVSAFDPMFIELLAYDLAVAIAFKVKEGNTDLQRVAELRKQRAQVAKAIDGQESPPIKVERVPALYARRAGSTRSNHRIIF